MDTVAWLLAADPAIRWQTMRDLTGAAPHAVAAERARVAGEGLGAALLRAQQADGTWRTTDTPAWASTLYTLLLLRSTGVDPGSPAVQAALARVEDGLYWSDYQDRWDLRAPEFGGKPFSQGEEEPCINGGTLAVAAYFGLNSKPLAERLLSEQLDDGGWNCEAPRSRVSSFHTTICVLEGLLEHERAAGPSPEIAAARRRGEEYLLERGLFRRRSTGVVIDEQFLQLHFPSRYRYDILRALDYLVQAGAAHDPRVGEAVRLLTGKRQADGLWLLDGACDETVAVSTEEIAGRPSAWITLRALRVLRGIEPAHGRGQ